MSSLPVKRVSKAENENLHPCPLRSGYLSPGFTCESAEIPMNGKHVSSGSHSQCDPGFYALDLISHSFDVPTMALYKIVTSERFEHCLFSMLCGR